LILKVPVGTLVTDVATGKVLHYFADDEEKFPVLHGGSGGLGNMEFKTPILQYPSFAIL
jgi:GTP-binding protein